MAGSLRKRGKNSWELTVSAGVDSNKKRQRFTRTVKANSLREAKKLLAQFVAEVEKGQFISPSKLTLKEFSEKWLEDHGWKYLAPKTVHRYKQLLELRILPALGHLRLEKIRTIHIIEFYNNLAECSRLDGREGHLSESTIHHHHRVLSAILQDAVQWQIIGENPCRRVSPPKVRKKEAAHYDEEQTVALLEAVEREPLKYKVYIWLSVFSGARRGELMGLEWPDVDFEAKTLKIRQTSQYVPGKGLITKDTKNESSFRTIAIPDSLLGLLSQYKVKQAEVRLKLGDKWKDSNRLFVTWDGQPMSPDSMTSWFPKFLKRHGLPHIPLHGLRHTAATYLISQDINIKSVSSRLGHANTSTTLNVYAHALKSTDREAADKMEDLIMGRKKKLAVNTKKLG